MAKILVVSEVFYPDKTSTAHILTRIADCLAIDHNVEVICSNANYGNVASSLSDMDKPYPITRIGAKKYDKNKVVSRAWSLCKNSLLLIKKLSSAVKKEDHVIIVTNPAPILLLVGVLKRIRHFHLTIIVHDVFPENAVAAKLVKDDSGLFYRILLSIFNRSYAAADRLIVLGRDMLDIVLKKVAGSRFIPDVHVIENWSDPYPDYDSDCVDDSYRIRILYAGNIGRCQGLEHFTEAFASVRNELLEFEIRGSGAIEDDIKAIVSSRNCDNVKIGGPYLRDEQFKILQGCDLALVTLADGMYGLGVPSKAYNILSAGKAILFIGDLQSEIAVMVKEHGIGYCFDAKDSVGLVRWLESLTIDDKKIFMEMGLRARTLSLTRYSQTSILNKYRELFCE